MSAAATCCDSNHGAVDQQCRGAATGCGVNAALEVSVGCAVACSGVAVGAGICRVDNSLRTCGNGDLSGGGATLAVAFTAGCGLGFVPACAVAGDALKHADTAGCRDDFYGCAGGDTDGAGDLGAASALAACHDGAASAAGEGEAEFAYARRDGEGFDGLAAVCLSLDGVGGAGLCTVGGVGGYGCGGCDDGQCPCCAGEDGAAGGVCVVRHGVFFHEG